MERIGDTISQVGDSGDISPIKKNLCRALNFFFFLNKDVNTHVFILNTDSSIKLASSAKVDFRFFFF